MILGLKFKTKPAGKKDVCLVAFQECPGKFEENLRNTTKFEHFWMLLGQIA